MATDVVPGIAEEIVEDAFAAMRLQWRRLRDPDRGVAFLRRFVVDAARCVDSLSAASRGGLPALSGPTLAALRQLPARQREALVLRYYAELPEDQAAAAMGVTRAAFRGHVGRGMAALRLLLDSQGVAGLSTAQCTAVHRSTDGCALSGAFMHSNSQRYAQGVHRVIHRRWPLPGRYQAEEDLGVADSSLDSCSREGGTPVPDVVSVSASRGSSAAYTTMSASVSAAIAVRYLRQTRVPAAPTPAAMAAPSAVHRSVRRREERLFGGPTCRAVLRKVSETRGATVLTSALDTAGVMVDVV
jgi:predicted DNA-binding protein (UPF0251 family)